ncbi:MAG TPA: archaellin/type IV pilin N-terminal domain-containing protein [Candidatus Acidoferrum sp.]|nr:archaellin/type IV pilin N-terminal domain-containing protein [Candidatus Acidoferrum sp.]
MNYIRKFKKNAKALSPVVASIILIAVTVAVSVVVAAWMGGMTIGLMGSAEQASITNVQFTPGGAVDTFTVLVQNSGSSPITISNNVYINGASATDSNGTATIAKISSGNIVLTMPTGTLSAGSSYAIKMVTAKGTQISYTATYSP